MLSKEIPAKEPGVRLTDSGKYVYGLAQRFVDNVCPLIPYLPVFPVHKTAITYSIIGS